MQTSSKRARADADAKAVASDSSGSSGISSSSTAAASESSSTASPLRSLTLHADEIVHVRPMLSHSLHCPFVASEISQCKASLESEGYLLLRGLLPRQTIMDARRAVLEHLRERGLIHAERSTACADSADFTARAVDPAAPTNLLSASVTHMRTGQHTREASRTSAYPSFVPCSFSFALHRSPALLAALEHPRLFELFGQICDPAPIVESEGAAASAFPAAAAASSAPSACVVWTSDFKWLRGVPRGLCTGWHVDRVYMRSQQNRLLSLWMPLGDLAETQGNIVAIPQSHRTAQFERLREEYAQGLSGAKGNGTTSGWIQLKEYTDQPIEVRGEAPLALRLSCSLPVLTRVFSCLCLFVSM